MTKLEEKLIELGYEECLWEKGKWDNKKYNIVIFTNEEITKIEDYYAFSNQIRKQTTIDFTQASFNEMQRDLEVLREYESK